jgi:hypothetical protein
LHTSRFRNNESAPFLLQDGALCSSTVIDDRSRKKGDYFFFPPCSSLFVSGLVLELLAEALPEVLPEPDERLWLPLWPPF